MGAQLDGEPQLRRESALVAGLDGFTCGDSTDDEREVNQMVAKLVGRGELGSGEGLVTAWDGSALVGLAQWQPYRIRKYVDGVLINVIALARGVSRRALRRDPRRAAAA